MRIPLCRASIACLCASSHKMIEKNRLIAQSSNLGILSIHVSNATASHSGGNLVPVLRRRAGRSQHLVTTKRRSNLRSASRHHVNEPCHFSSSACIFRLWTRDDDEWDVIPLQKRWKGISFIRSVPARSLHLNNDHGNPSATAITFSMSSPVIPRRQYEGDVSAHRTGVARALQNGRRCEKRCEDVVGSGGKPRALSKRN